jgi:hypothetical protein
MRWMSIILSVAILALNVWADPGNQSKFTYDPNRIQLAQVMTQPEASPAPDTTMGMPNLQTQNDRLNPGKALLLSAIIPGAGQFYAKSPIFGGLFIAAEIAAWYGVASYHSKGMNTDDEFHAFADQNWTYYDSLGGDFGSYLSYEFWVATTYGTNGDSTTKYYGIDPGVDDFTEWQDLPWDDRLEYLPSGFTHHLDPNDQDQQYYEMIGKYDQFWAGWPSDGNYGSGSNQHWTWDAYENSSGNWIHNTYRDHYQDLRRKSNDALDMSKNFTMVVMGNHLLSALHAGFAVSMHNRKVAREQKIEGALQLEPRKYNNEHLTMATLRVKF